MRERISVWRPVFIIFAGGLLAAVLAVPPQGTTGRSKAQTVPDWWRKMVKVYDAILERAGR